MPRFYFQRKNVAGHVAVHAQSPGNHIFIGVAVGLPPGYLPSAGHLRHQRMVVGHLPQPFLCGQISPAVADVSHDGALAVGQQANQRRAHAGQAAVQPGGLIDGLIGRLSGRRHKIRHLIRPGAFRQLLLHCLSKHLAGGEAGGFAASSAAHAVAHQQQRPAVFKLTQDIGVLIFAPDHACIRISPAFHILNPSFLPWLCGAAARRRRRYPLPSCDARWR